MDQSIVQNVFTDLDRLKDYINHIVMSYEKLKEMVYIDELTGLCNMRYFRRRLDEELARTQRHRRNFSIIMMDIDNFGQIRETIGIQSGNVILRKVARCIKNSLRTIDIVARLSGDVFVILLPETEIDCASSIAARIKEQVEAEQIAQEKEEIPLPLSVSGGIVCFDDPSKDGTDFLGVADLLLCRAKKEGRGSFKCINISESE